MPSPLEDRLFGSLQTAIARVDVAQGTAEILGLDSIADDLLLIGVELRRVANRRPVRLFEYIPGQTDIVYPKGVPRRHGPTSPRPELP
jgi:hypothetical protein